MKEILSFRDRYAKLTRQELREKIKHELAFRQELEALYERATGLKLNKSCSDCWMDAYIVLMTIKQITTMQEKNFELKAGALLIDVVSHDNAKLCSRHNLTDELALYHLKTNPACRKKFSKVPENLDELLAAMDTASDETDPTGTGEGQDGEGANNESGEGQEGANNESGDDSDSNATQSGDDNKDEAEHAKNLEVAKNAVSQAKRNLSLWQNKLKEAEEASVKDEGRIKEAKAKVNSATELLKEAQEALKKLEA